ncbi:MAG TPA: class I fructose-bisphosphate aldolase [Patescibacteria group bacterium]
MDLPGLEKTAHDLVAPGKGILAADESFPTIEKRFKAINIESTEQTRRAYRELLFSTPGIEEYISGIIQFDETLKQKVLTNSNVISGIKVDEGLADFPNYPGDKVTKGIESLQARLKEYSALGAKFTKWRAAFTISEVNPSIQAVEENARLLAEFASLSQSEGLVPIVEPEVLMDGVHSMDKCYETTRSILKIVFLKLSQKGVDFKAMLLKPNMILPGKDNPNKPDPEEVAQKTLEVLKDTVPQDVPGIVFLSGGQTEEEATDNLRQLNKVGNAPWQLSFSYGRALQNSALKIWAGKSENVKAAQEAFLARAKMNSLARYGK